MFLLIMGTHAIQDNCWFWMESRVTKNKPHKDMYAGMYAYVVQFFSVSRVN